MILIRENLKKVHCKINKNMLFIMQLTISKEKKREGWRNTVWEEINSKYLFKIWAIVQYPGKHPTVLNIPLLFPPILNFYQNLHLFWTIFYKLHLTNFYWIIWCFGGSCLKDFRKFLLRPKAFYVSFNWQKSSLGHFLINCFSSTCLNVIASDLLLTEQ